MLVRFVVVASLVFSMPVGARTGKRSALDLTVTRVDEHTIRVQGHGFDPQARIVVSADIGIPHASTACYYRSLRIT